MGFCFVFQMGIYFFEQFFVRVIFIIVDIYNESISIGDDIMLCVGIYLCYVYFDGVQQGGFFWEFIIMELLNVFQYFVNSIYFFIVCGMFGFFVCGNIQYY